MATHGVFFLPNLQVVVLSNPDSSRGLRQVGRKDEAGIKEQFINQSIKQVLVNIVIFVCINTRDGGCEMCHSVTRAGRARDDFGAPNRKCGAGIFST